MEIGDKVRVDGMAGVVLAMPSEGKYSTAYPAGEWAYLKVGFLIETEDAGLVHCPTVDSIEIAD